jgi:predicted Zn-dependent protease
MKLTWRTTLLIFIIFPVLFIRCSKDENADNTFNIFSVQDDIDFGRELQKEIQSNPATYPLLDKNQYNEAYNHLNRIRDSILMSDQLKYGDDFDWEIDIIQDDSVLNAFCAPGGYICIYTGIIKYLDHESQLAGVLGHEMAHADRRHSTDQLTKAYGIQLMLSIVLGNDPNTLTEIAANLAAGVATLAFSRDAEYESDEYSVKYLYETAYDARGVGGFFQKLDSTNATQPPEFLSTHPHPDNRYDKIVEYWESLGGKEGLQFTQSYQQLKNSLP